MNRLPLKLIAVLALVVLTPEVHAGTSSTIGNFLNPLTWLLEQISGTAGRILAALALIGVAVSWYSKRNDEGPARLVGWFFATALILGAAEITSSAGFVGATF